MIVSANLRGQALKIYNKINKLRKKGWFSKDISVMLVKNYANEKDIIVQQIKDNQKEIDRVYKQNQDLAKKLRGIK